MVRNGSRYSLGRDQNALGWQFWKDIKVLVTSGKMHPRCADHAQVGDEAQSERWTVRRRDANRGS